MDLETDDKVIRSCLRKIEDHLGWGSGENWSTQEFESLSKKIQEVTGVILSVATLKRLWGKIRYDSKPTATTLNTLAQFIGYENWITYKQSQRSVSENSNGQAKTHLTTKRKRIGLPIALLIIAILLSLASVYYFLTGPPTTSPINASQFQFSSKKVVDIGVPNTVIFDYDASQASDTDSVYIQQSWDKRLSTLVNKDQKQHTSIYYYPGFFAAKLRINDTIVKEHNLIINTAGWLPLIEQKPVPVYFKETDAIANGSLGISIEQIQESNIHLQPHPPRVAYFNVREFGDVTTHDLILETELKNDYAEGANACQFSEVYVLFEGGALVVPLSAKGCVSELNFMNMEGKKSDLSALGCDFSDWVKFKVEFVPDSFKISVANNILKFPLDARSAKMVGVAFKFQGTGSVNSVTISNHSGEIVYNEDFD